ncbi:MAG: Sua5/YciO/YrdC/YwlC family protein, partial [Dysgonamonadaceae bacterium]
GIRITTEKFSSELCRQYRKPIVSTSANISGEPSPASFKYISDIVKEKVDYVVEYRQSDVSKTSPSSIIKLDKSGTIEIIRK